MDCPFWQLLSFSELFAIQHDTLDYLSMINSPSRDEWVSYRNTSANNKGTGGSPQSEKRDCTFWFKVVTDSTSHLWNNSEPQAAAWCIRVKNKWKTLTLNPEDQRNPTYRTDSVSQVSRTWRQKDPSLNKDKKNTVFRLLDKTTNAHLLRIPKKPPFLTW